MLNPNHTEAIVTYQTLEPPFEEIKALSNNTIRLNKILRRAVPTAERYKEKFSDYYCPVKNVYVVFRYDNCNYIIYPGLYDMEPDVFEIFADRYLSQLLADAGCTEIYCSGLID